MTHVQFRGQPANSQDRTLKAQKLALKKVHGRDLVLDSVSQNETHASEPQANCLMKAKFIVNVKNNNNNEMPWDASELTKSIKVIFKTSCFLSLFIT